ILPLRAAPACGGAQRPRRGSGRVEAMLDEDTQAALRLCVHEFRASTVRRSFAPELHLGQLRGRHLSWPIDDQLLRTDAGLRTDLALHLAERATVFDPRPSVWLTRVGLPEPHDVDAAWLPAVRRGFAELGVEPTCVV